MLPDRFNWERRTHPEKWLAASLSLRCWAELKEEREKLSIRRTLVFFLSLLLDLLSCEQASAAMTGIWSCRYVFPCGTRSPNHEWNKSFPYKVISCQTFGHSNHNTITNSSTVLECAIVIGAVSGYSKVQSFFLILICFKLRRVCFYIHFYTVEMMQILCALNKCCLAIEQFEILWKQVRMV